MPETVSLIKLSKFFHFIFQFAAYSDCYLEFDLFGIEVSHYQANEDIDFPSDCERIQRIKALIDGGYLDRVVIAHDIHTRHRLVRILLKVMLLL